MSTVARPRMSVAEYLSAERSGTERHEYVDGEVFAMGGASHAHNRIVSNLVFELRRALGDGACYPLASDMRVRTAVTRFVYPDVVVICPGARLEDGDVLLDPAIVFEVLSETAEAYDRGAKFALYRQIESLREYVLVSQHERRVERFVREPDARWLWSETTSGIVSLTSLSVSIPLDGVYHGV